MGRRARGPWTRFGVFAAADEQGRYLAWDVPEQVYKTLATQPAQQVDFNAARNEGSVTVLLDPSRGELFALLDRMPTLMERIEQGGVVGYLIIALGLLGLLVALYQMLRLLRTELGIRQQLLQVTTIDEKNPLGRVLGAVQCFERKDKEELNDQLELCVDEAILKELPWNRAGAEFPQASCGGCTSTGLAWNRGWHDCHLSEYHAVRDQ